MAEEVQILIDIEAGKSAKTLGELEDRTEALNEALRGARLGTAEYRKLEQQLINNSRQVKNLELSFESLDNEQVASEIGSVAGAIGDVTGAMILLGGENEELEEIAKNIEKGLGVSMAFKGGIEGATSAMKLLKAASPFAIIVTVITLVVAGIVLLIANLEKVIFFFKVMFGLFSEQELAEQEAHAKKMARSREIAEANTARIKQIEEEAEARRKAFNTSQEQTDLEISALEAVGKSSFALRLQKEEDSRANLLAQLDEIDKLSQSWTIYYEEQFALSGQSREVFFKALKGQGIDLEDLAQQRLELQEKVELEITKSEIKISKIRFDQRKIDKANSDKANAVDKAADEKAQAEFDRLQAEQAAAADELFARRIAARDRLRQIEQDKSADDFQLTINELQRQHDAQMELLDELIPEENALKLELEEQFLIDLREIRDQANQSDLDAEATLREERLANQEEMANAAFAVANNALKSLEAINAGANKKEIARIDAKIAAGEQLTKKEAKQKERQNKINKAFAIAQIAIDTAIAISGAIAQAQSVPFPGNLVAMAVGVAAVIGNIIAATQILGASSPVTSGGVGAETASTIGEIEDLTNQPPDVNGVSSGSTVLGDQRVVVLESDITGTQKQVEVNEAAAIFG